MACWGHPGSSDCRIGGRGTSLLSGSLCPAPPGSLSNPGFFNYGVETHEAYKKRSLSSDIIEEQRKLQEADLVIFQVGFPSLRHWLFVQTLSRDAAGRRTRPSARAPLPSGNGVLPVFVSLP